MSNIDVIMTCYLAWLEGYVWSEPHASSVGKYQKIFSFFLCRSSFQSPGYQAKILFCLDSVGHNSFRKYPLALSHHLGGLCGLFGGGGTKQNKTMKTNEQPNNLENEMA